MNIFGFAAIGALVGALVGKEVKDFKNFEYRVSHRDDNRIKKILKEEHRKEDK